MVDKIIVNPENVRCGGNIISPQKTLSDFQSHKGNINETQSSINGITFKTYHLTPNSS